MEGTVLAPTDVEVVALGSAIDLTVSNGPAVSAAPFKLRALTPSAFSPSRSDTIVATVAATGTGRATVVLVDAHGARLASWHKALRAGLNRLQLQLPIRVRRTLIHRPGSYWLAWTATSNGESANDRKRILMLRR
jgi:hypothetical protein